jgi:DNA-binding Xre family transcriptional regulator
VAEQRRIGFHWHLRRVMAAHNLWKSTELRPLLSSRGVNLSDAQVYRLVTGEPQRIPSRTFAALCDTFRLHTQRLVRTLCRDASGRISECATPA